MRYFNLQREPRLLKGDRRCEVQVDKRMQFCATVDDRTSIHGGGEQSSMFKHNENCSSWSGWQQINESETGYNKLVSLHHVGTSIQRTHGNRLTGRSILDRRLRCCICGLARQADRGEAVNAN